VSYPQQNQPQGQQPGNSGQGWQPQGGYPPPVGQYGAYQQQPGSYPQPGGYGPPPPKNKTGLWVGLAFGLVILIALGITGFVAPGFFLSKDDKPAAINAPASQSQSSSTGTLPSKSGISSPPQGGNTQAPSGSSDVDPAAQAQAQKLVEALNAKDSTAANALLCSDATDKAKETISTAIAQSGWHITKATLGKSGASLFTIDGLVNGQTGFAILSFFNDPGGYCLYTGSPAEQG